jgi:hypothetical protein
MPRRKLTPEEIAIQQQLQDLIKNIKGNEKPAVNVTRALSLFKRAQALTEQAIAVLEGREEDELAAGKKKAGRPRKAIEGDLFDSIPPGETRKVKSASDVTNKKGAGTEPKNA